ncbi:hypothetical protein VKT23_014338 [Stygiomarasmius scandens]|uniref:Uncharacterized protein n=1 Tax=Marasmiellus scandens TaxID=2682957 RepID=A0ABR1J0D4_9AGAR
MHPYSKSSSRQHPSSYRRQVNLYHPYSPASPRSPRSGNVASGGSGILNDPPQTFSVMPMDVDIPRIHIAEFDLLRPDTSHTWMNQYELGEKWQMATIQDRNVDKILKLNKLQNALEATRDVMATFNDPPVQPEIVAQIEYFISAVKSEMSSSHSAALGVVDV